MNVLPNSRPCYQTRTRRSHRGRNIGRHDRNRVLLPQSLLLRAGSLDGGVVDRLLLPGAKVEVQRPVGGGVREDPLGVGWLPGQLLRFVLAGEAAFRMRPRAETTLATYRIR